MEIYRVEDLTFSYPKSRFAALSGVSLTVLKGDFVTLCGPSGCGKTTLLRHLKPSAALHGDVRGRVLYQGAPLTELSQREQAAKIGFVSQSPENQIVTDKVWHELAYGLESLGMKTPEIRLKVAEMASYFGIQNWFHKAVSELSGGQKQILVLASVMAMQPEVLILDEPTSQLDPIAAGEFIATLGKLNRDLGLTVILSEHRLEDALPISNRAMVMSKGRIVADGEPRKVALELCGRGSSMFLAMPVATRIWAAASGTVAVVSTAVDSGAGVSSADTTSATSTETVSAPITVREGADWLATQTLHMVDALPQSKASGDFGDLGTGSSSDSGSGSCSSSGGLAIELKSVRHRYTKAASDVLRGMSFKAAFGEISALLGGNGTGKTTALSIIAGLYKPYSGTVVTSAKVAMLPQDPQTLFSEKTVYLDLMDMLSGEKLTAEQKEDRFSSVVGLCRLEGLLDAHPYDLSGGEQQRAALAKVLLTKPGILLLDEPTKGFDAQFKRVFAAILRSLASEGVSVVIASHDVEFCAEYTDRCALVFDGDIVTQNTPAVFFAGNNFYTTSASRMSRALLPWAVTAGDVIQALGIVPESGSMDGGPDGDDGEKAADAVIRIPDIALEPEHRVAATGHKGSWMRPGLSFTRESVAALVLLLGIPFTIYMGIHLFGDRRYYIISLLIIFQTLIPFILLFEGRRPQARELVLLSVMCAIAVAGRAAFFMLPQFKPVIALVIISGVAFGGEAGFLIGAVSGFISNMFIGQGPWTPWQMFAFGIIGFLSGLLYSGGRRRRTTASLVVFGVFSALVIYGLIMDTAAVVMYQQQINGLMLLASFAQGLPFNLLHGAATAVFLALISRPMLEKLDRIKVKYGIYG